MKSRSRFWTGLIGAIGLLVLILDAKTALGGAKDGVSLCLYTVIPSLFPFFVLSILLNSSLSNVNVGFLRPLGRLCGIPAGGESLLLLGMLGGYPVGAQCISEAYRSKRLNRRDAHRMLGFCSNAGPAFIFGMGSCIFESQKALWALWGIHVLSALLVGVLLPNKSCGSCSLSQSERITVSQALEKGIKSIAVVCGWVVLFRVLLAFVQRWFLWLLPAELQVFTIGILELSNGCYELTDLTSQGMRFILCAGMLGFGGVCVAMQTISVSKELGTGLYFPGKVLQCVLSLFLACLMQGLLFTEPERYFPILGGTFACVLPAFVAIFAVTRKKSVAISY